ncbi:chemotaxis protein CheA [Stutzerimonas azotifigens]|uniref:Chemotaxis protein CheA n=1 Tax=Stutzerimonas azotifigens TaxID=291995 RepID=A0ABR5Z527_9GAMM|nr:chemotaxis protein CheA [Stutzerimonas azotifigens]MBA1275330.1 chemotaxis protein CheA [Stutzerimonas azotifigens]
MNLDEILTVFIAESRELLVQMEQSLLLIEQSPTDQDTINAIFRAAHTIKGSAGLFGLDVIVGFTHVAESVLDCIRAGELEFDGELAALFLEVGDHLGRLIDHLDRHQNLDELPVSSLEAGQALVARLTVFLPDGTPCESAANVSADVAVGNVSLCGGAQAGGSHWHLSLRFGADTLRNGMDPLSIFRYLQTFGRLVAVVPVLDHLPAAEEMDPETCYLGFEVAFASDADQPTIEGAFEFVRDDSLVRILAPHCGTQEYLALIKELPEDDDWLTEAFIRCGTLTSAEPEQPSRPQSQPLPDAEESVTGTGLAELASPPTVAAAAPLQAKPVQAKEARTHEGNLIRVDAGKLDQLINLIGELIIAGAGARMHAQQTGSSEMVESTEVLSRLVEEVRDSALTLRMVQIGATFNRFQRVVRDVSKELGKDIQLTISGGETELDKTVVERIGDPLTHLVRNAMDHGIEPAPVRRANGKPEQGRVTLNAYHEASSIVIEVSDDGGGLNAEKILSKAIQRGLVAEGQTLPERDILNLIFEPGFSTAEQVSNLSGRGVGMDVVKRNITALRGTIELESELGVGTCIRIRLPLTLAIIDGFLIGVGQAGYVVPLDMVEECIELDSCAGTDREYLDLRGDVLPFIRLRDLFEHEGTPPRRENVVVVSYAGIRAGLVVDQLMGEFQTVIKPLGKLFEGASGMGGFTILGSGAVALILDIPGLLNQLAQRRPRDRVYATQPA